MIFAAMNFPARNVIDELKTIRDLGFEMAELTMDPPKADFKTIQSMSSSIKTFLEDNRMGLICHLPTFVSIGDLSRLIREASLQEIICSMEVAKELGVKKATLHPPYHQGLSKFAPELFKAACIESLSKIAQKAYDLDLKICVENLFSGNYSVTDVDLFHDLFQEFPLFGLTLDIGHANIGQGGLRPTIAFIEQFKERLCHVHVSDNFGKQDNHLPIGAGTINFQEITKALISSKYDDTVTLEIFSKDKEYLKLSKQKVEEMLDANSR